METCDRCGATLRWDSDRCPKCWKDVGCPNVRAGARERADLHRRYTEAFEAAIQRGAGERVEAFESKVAADSEAAVAVPAEFLRMFVDSDRALDAPYTNQVDAGVRLPAPAGADHQRRAVDALIAGNYADAIVFAALSLHGSGPQSYGACSLVLQERAVAGRASVLEHNSYHFVRRHAIVPGDPVPAGYYATWNERSYLAVAKLAPSIHAGTSDARFAPLLLHDSGDRDQDDFVEVHVFGALDVQCVRAVTTPAPTHAARAEDIDLERARDAASVRGLEVWTR